MAEGKIRHVNVGSDFRVVFEFPDKKLPTFPWRLEMRTIGTPAYNTYTASFDGTLYNRCVPLKDGSILVLVNNHRLSTGTLCYSLKSDVPDALFPDGEMNIATPGCTSIELWNGPSEDLPPEQIGAIVAFLKGDDGISPTVEVVETTDEVKLQITDAEGVKETPNLVGPKGERGSQGLPGASAGCTIVNRLTCMPILPCWFSKGQTVCVKDEHTYRFFSRPVVPACAAVRVRNAPADEDPSFSVFGDSERIENVDLAIDSTLMNFDFVFPAATTETLYILMQMFVYIDAVDADGNATSLSVGGSYNDNRWYNAIPVGTVKLHFEVTLGKIFTVAVAIFDQAMMDAGPLYGCYRYTGEAEMTSFGLTVPKWEKILVHTRWIKALGKHQWHDRYTGFDTPKAQSVFDFSWADGGDVNHSWSFLKDYDRYDSEFLKRFALLLYTRRGGRRDKYSSRRSYYGHKYMAEATVMDLITEADRLRNGLESTNDAITGSLPKKFVGGRFVCQWMDIAFVCKGRNSHGEMSPFVQGADMVRYRLIYKEHIDKWTFARV